MIELCYFQGDDQFDEAWQQSLRPTLTDYNGDAFLFSTPTGIGNFWYEINQNRSGNWQVFSMPTSSNPFIRSEEIDAARQE